MSRWCVPQRKKAKQIVETWDQLFNSSQKEQRVSFLYLANDILQNSRRKGSEFVNEFWKVLPAALKHVYESSDEHGRKAVSRLWFKPNGSLLKMRRAEFRGIEKRHLQVKPLQVDIWEERKVFGSRGRSLKDEMLGKELPISASNGKSPNPIKVVKKDAHSVRIKLAVGGMPEKIVSAFQSVLDEYFNEETALNKCRDAVDYIIKMEKDVESTLAQGNECGSILVEELQEQENVLCQCVGQLKSAEDTRATLISRLKEALHDQVL
ncbi:CID domain [Dillenia turbinata]|uniref:CID domain n=1 Tax=Dillenia turbinata TaxID=194707 RepID=A0AAN8WDE7_9MAGN